MRVEVDRDVCTGHGRCWALAPDVYDADDSGYCITPSTPVAPGREEAARLGAANCPEGAIEVIEEGGTTS